MKTTEPQMDFPNLEVFKTYLSMEFPDAEIIEKDDFTLGVRRFKIDADPNRYMLKVSREYAADTSAEVIVTILETHNVGDLMRTPDIDHVFLGNDGPEIRW